jgi:hypothetical protein
MKCKDGFCLSFRVSPGHHQPIWQHVYSVLYIHDSGHVQRSGYPMWDLGCPFFQIIHIGHNHFLPYPSHLTSLDKLLISM